MPRRRVSGSGQGRVCERLRELEWRWQELETLWDIDRPEDYHRWSELIIINENKYLA